MGIESALKRKRKDLTIVQARVIFLDILPPENNTLAVPLGARSPSTHRGVLRSLR